MDHHQRYVYSCVYVDNDAGCSTDAPIFYFFIFCASTVCFAEPVDVVLVEGWMLGFDPLTHVPLPVDPRSLINNTINTSGEGDVSDAAPSAVVSDQEFKTFEEAYAKARSIKVWPWSLLTQL